jgi:hypothetical protein
MPQASLPTLCVFHPKTWLAGFKISPLLWHFGIWMDHGSIRMRFHRRFPLPLLGVLQIERHLYMQLCEVGVAVVRQ